MNGNVNKISFSFPIVKCELRIESTKVKKPSGISFIFLELIRSYHSKKTLLKDELELFGIPKDLHYIFSKEISYLCSQNIVKYQGGNSFNEIDFNSCYIDEFAFSEFGLKVFKDESIPTEEKKYHDIIIYYDMVNKEFLYPEQLKGKIEHSAQSVYSNFEYTDIEENMIDFEGIFEENRNKFKAKTEEIYQNGKIKNKENMILKVSNVLQVKFCYTKVFFDFVDLMKNNFLKEKLYAEILENHLKNEFVFNISNGYNIPEKNVNNLPWIGNVENIYAPSQIEKRLERKSDLVFDRNIFKIKNKNNNIIVEREISEKILDAIDPCVVSAYIEKSNIYFICPIKMSFYNDDLDEYISINTVFEFKADEEYTNKLYKVYEEYIFSSEFSILKAKILGLLVNIHGNNELIKKYLYYLKKQKVGDYSNIIDFYKILKNKDDWKTIYEECVLSIFEDKRDTISNIDNLIQTHDALKTLKDTIEMTDVEFIKYLTSNIDVEQHYNILFSTFEGYKYKVENIIPSINIVELYMKNIIDGNDIENSIIKTTIIGDFIRLNDSFKKLKEFLGIETYLDHHKEIYDNRKYNENYKEFKDRYKVIEKFVNFAPREFEEMDEYIKIFDAVHEIVAMELSAMEAPKAITKEYIENLILKADLKNAICDMHIRLQDFVLDYYNENKFSSEMLKKLVEDGIVIEKIMGVLRQLVDCRNGLQHPRNRSINLKKENVVKWCDALFELVEGGKEKNESSSED